ncbi:resolvase [Butyrivibrio sp. TB]|uniref:resolvase n=1 Tax=Butyrivibrio sp. TB TaxID=1520809 RepID=UPI001FA933A8|nr:resolvase [Butyrivibrio sp. TB]
MAKEKVNGQWLKSIEFKLPIISKDMKISLDNGSQIETVVLLTKTEHTYMDMKPRTLTAR